MGIYTYLMEHSPVARQQRVTSSFLYGGVSQGISSGIHESIGFGRDAASLIGIGVLLATPIDETAGVVSLTSPSAGLTLAGALQTGLFYDPGKLDPYSIGLSRKVTRTSIRSSRRSGGPVEAKMSGGTKPSKPTRSGSTSKPFWDSGKPKCKKGFRYDFKRKLCVKIK
jgi:hypothetical protein